MPPRRGTCHQTPRRGAEPAPAGRAGGSRRGTRRLRAQRPGRARTVPSEAGDSSRQPRLRPPPAFPARPPAAAAAPAPAPPLPSLPSLPVSSLLQAPGTKEAGAAAGSRAGRPTPRRLARAGRPLRPPRRSPAPPPLPAPAGRALTWARRGGALRAAAWRSPPRTRREAARLLGTSRRSPPRLLPLRNWQRPQPPRGDDPQPRKEAAAPRRRSPASPRPRAGGGAGPPLASPHRPPTAPRRVCPPRSPAGGALHAPAQPGPPRPCPWERRCSWPGMAAEMPAHPRPGRAAAAQGLSSAGKRSAAASCSTRG